MRGTGGDVMMISFFALLILLGGCGAVVALFVFAIVSKKLWVIPVTGAFVFFGLIAIGLLLSLAIPTASSNIEVKVPSAAQVIQDVNDVTRTVVRSSPNVTYNGVPMAPFWVAGLSVSHTLLFLVLGVVLVVTVFRRILSPHAGHGLRRAWPLVAVIIFIAVMFV